MHIAQVEPVGLSVDLEEAARLERSLDHTRNVDVARAARADAPAGEMADAVDVRVLHRLEDTLGRAVLGCVVHRRDDPVEARELVLRHVDLAVRPDVRLDAREDPQLRIALAHLLDRLELRCEPAVAQVVRVVGDRVVLVAALDRRRDHLLERVLAVGRPVGVGMEIAAQLGELDERRELVSPCRLELAARLAQLRRDRLIAEELVQRVLVLRLEHVARLDGRDAVLGDREPPPHGVFTQRDVVILGTGEMLQQVAVRLGRDDAQIEAQAVVGENRRLRVAVRDHLDDPRKLREERGQLGRIGCSRDDVEVAKRLFAPPHGSGLGDVHSGRMLAQGRDDRLYRGQPVAEQTPSGVRILRLKRERLQDLLLALRAEPGQRAQALVLGGGLQLLERRDAELLPDARGGLRPEPR